ncbi:MAG: ATP-binding cassette domain-containing protein [Firmicutes bacterium]|nr:ATP-binding cassette domain-containing protein [Bacillota bacterium]
MPIVIEVRELVRNFKIAKRDKNLWRFLFKRQYEIKEAVAKINFNISRSELVGFIGPNGAGKSTTIKMLTGILVPTSGFISVLGNTPHLKRKENASKIGVVFGQRSQLWWDLPVIDSFDLLRRIYKIPINSYQKNIKIFTELLEIDKFIHTPVRQLSLGQRMRADFVAALLHEPEILFLDEPTIGLDIVAKKQLREFIKRVRTERGLTVILTTHDMKDIEEICERIIMIDKGRIILDTKVSEIIGKIGGINTLIVDFEVEPVQIKIPFVDVTLKENCRWYLSFQREKISASELIAKIMTQSSVSDIFLKEPNIEDIIRDIYTGKILL